MALHKLPVELLLFVAENVKEVSILNALARANSYLYQIVNPILYLRDFENAVAFAARSRCLHPWYAFQDYCDVTYRTQRSRTCSESEVKNPSYGIGDRCLRSLASHVSSGQLRGSRALTWAAIHGRETVAQKSIREASNFDAAAELVNTVMEFPLALAAAMGHDAVIKTMLTIPGLQLSWNSQCPNKAYHQFPGPPLSCAASNGHPKVVRMMLARDDGSENEKDVCGRTPLVLAVLGAAFDRSIPPFEAVVRSLISLKHVRPDDGDHDRRHPLFVAIRHRHKEIVKLLLTRSDLDVNCKLPLDGDTALMAAVRLGDEEIVELLLARQDVDVNLEQLLLETSLLSPISKNPTTIVNLLLARHDIDVNLGKEGNTAVSEAASVESLLARDDLSLGLEVTKRHDHYGISSPKSWKESALIEAACSGHTEVVKLLLSHLEVDLNAKSPRGKTALTLAALCGHCRTVELLCTMGVDVNIKDSNGSTALMNAALRGHKEVVKLLLAKDVDVNQQDNDGQIALTSASCEGHEEIVKLLLAKGVDVNIKDNYGWTALMEASYEGHEEAVKVLLAENVDMNVRDNGGETALIKASYKGHEEIVKLLLTMDANVNIRDSRGRTALMAAVLQGRVGIVELLLRWAEIDTELEGDEGKTALGYAESELDTEIVNIFRARAGLQPVSLRDLAEL